MLRVVFDTNTLVSALITRGKPRLLLRKIFEGELILVISSQILDEFNRVMNRSKFQSYVDGSDIDKFVELISKISESIEVKSDLNIVKGDPTDNLILNVACDGRADYIVSGDKHLLALKGFKTVKIVRAAEMLKNI